jgi:hypothetical protein
VGLNTVEQVFGCEQLGDLSLFNHVVPEAEVPSSNDIAVCFRKKGEFVTRSIAGETVVVPVRGQVGDLDAIYNLNDVGGFIWAQFDDWKSVDQIIEAVHGEFEVALEQAEKEITEFITALEVARMVERSKSTA